MVWNDFNLILFHIEIFDTLSDVSTDNSGLEIIDVSENVKEKVDKTMPPIINLDSDNDSDLSAYDKTTDYLIGPPDCVITRQIDYLKIETNHIKNSDCSTSDSESIQEVIHLDNDLSFVIDGNVSDTIIEGDNPK